MRMVDWSYSYFTFAISADRMSRSLSSLLLCTKAFFRASHNREKWSEIAVKISKIRFRESTAKKERHCNDGRGASAPPHFDPMTANPTMPTHHDTKPNATITEKKIGEKERRKHDSCFTTMNHFYTQTWYPFYVVDARVEHFAPNKMAHHATAVTHHTGLTTCIIPYHHTMNSFPVLATRHQTFTTVIEPTAPEPTAVTDPTLKDHTVTEPNMTQPTVTNPTMPKSTVTEPTALKHTEMTTTVPQSTGGATLKTLTELTMTHLNLTEAYLNQSTMMTMYKLFPHYSHPPTLRKLNSSSTTSRRKHKSIWSYLQKVMVVTYGSNASNNGHRGST